MHEQVVIFQLVIVSGQICFYGGSNEKCVSFVGTSDGEYGITALAEYVIEVYEIALAVFISVGEGEALNACLQLQDHSEIQDGGGS